MTERANLAASVAARLLNRARETGDDFQTLLTSFCLERFPYRLSASPVCDRFVLKGAMLLRLWSDQPYRATRDLDLLRRGEGSFEAIRRDLEAICAVRVAPDAVVFDAASLRLESIRPEDEYAGTRARLPARCGTARLSLQVDMGLGDSVWPDPQRSAYPVLLEFPEPELLVYPREAVVAEKLEAMVVLGDRNSRIKDFFDLHHLASHFEFDRPTLGEAVRRTFERRHTPIPDEDPIGLTPAYWSIPGAPLSSMPSRDAQGSALLLCTAKRSSASSPPFSCRSSGTCEPSGRCRARGRRVAPGGSGQPEDLRQARVSFAVPTTVP